MARSILALAAVCLALTISCASADPMSYEGRGYGGPLGVGPNFRASEPAKPQARHKPSYKPSKRATSRPAKPTERAESAPEPAAPAKKEAVNRNSSIATGSTDAAAAAEKLAQETAAKPSSEPEATSVGCKRFIASVGETVTVPCE